MDSNAQHTPSMILPLDWAVAGCLLLGAVVAVASFSGWILVVGSHVVRAWMLGSALLLASLAFLGLRAKSQRESGGSGNNAPGNCARSAMLVLLLSIGGAGSMLGAASNLDTGYFILDPRGPDGCRVVVRESAFFMSGTGKAYAVGTTGIGRQGGEWLTDDGDQPIEAGEYTLEWRADGGQLIVDGAYNADRFDQRPISCR